MTTQTLTQEVHLVNIISIAEDKLQTNFRTITNKLKKHQQKYTEQDENMKKMEQNIYRKFKENQKATEHSIGILNDRIEKCIQLITAANSKNKQHDSLINQCLAGISSNKKQIQDMSNVFQQRNSQSKNQVDEIAHKLAQAQKDIYKAYQQILKKEDSTQVLKIYKDVEGTKQKLDKNQRQCKVLQHKLQKIEIQNQKSQRNQVKKQSQLIRQIEEKIKRQLKMLQKNMPSGSRYSNPGVSTGDFSDHTQLNSPEYNQTERKQKQNQDSLRLTFKLEEEQANAALMKSSLQKLSTTKFNQKLQMFENRIKSMQSSINNMISISRKNQKPESEQIKQKINQLKPEIIKIWAKCDTLDDRILFNERKAEDKSKLVNSLIQAQKQNNYGRLDQKFKAFQTQMYAALKQVKLKIEGKVNISDYEKQAYLLEERLKQITQLIYQKSDKLQVKKALLFLESKIKQIILVISQDEENQRDALLTKKQLKCMSCDKDIQKMNKFATTAGKGNWDALPYKQHSPEMLGKFGMTGFGSLSKKLKKIQSKDLPILKSKKNAHSVLQPIINTIPQSDAHNQSK